MQVSINELVSIIGRQQIQIEQLQNKLGQALQRIEKLTPDTKELDNN